MGDVAIEHIATFCLGWCEWDDGDCAGVSGKDCDGDGGGRIFFCLDNFFGFVAGMCESFLVAAPKCGVGVGEGPTTSCVVWGSDERRRMRHRRTPGEDGGGDPWRSTDCCRG